MKCLTNEDGETNLIQLAETDIAGRERQRARGREGAGQAAVALAGRGSIKVRISGDVDRRRGDEDEEWNRGRSGAEPRVSPLSREAGEGNVWAAADMRNV